MSNLHWLTDEQKDLLDTSITLLRPDEEEEPHPGTHIILTFPKTRGLPPAPREQELRLTGNQGRLQWHFSEKRKIDPTIELIRLIWELKPATQADIAKYKGVTAGRISQLCSKLRRKKFFETKSVTRPRR